jgi:hypothetical protein
VHLINDQTLGVSRAVYHTARAEKDARAEEYSAVKRVLSRDDIVIADGMNYIKGFRYQLYCEAKAVSTPSCVVSIPYHVQDSQADHQRSTSVRPLTSAARSTPRCWPTKTKMAGTRRKTLRT